MSYIKYNTPSCSYLRVPLKELQRLRIAHQILMYSYLQNEHIYLDEHEDMSLFLKAKRINKEEVSYSEVNITEEEFCKLSGKTLQ